MVRKRVQFEQEEEKKSSSSSIGPRKSYKKERKDHGRIRSVEGEEDEALEQVLYLTIASEEMKLISCSLMKKEIESLHLI